ncbi:MAG: hypothetical protein ACM30H_03595 [Clostridia bacterium]
MKLTKAILIGASVALAVGSAYAADNPKDNKDRSNASTTMGKAGTATRSEDSTFAKLDKNHDGYISKAEAMADPKLSKDFKSFDLNNDGKLNRAEYLAAAAKEDTGSLVDKAENKMSNKDSKASTGSSSTTKSTTK